MKQTSSYAKKERERAEDRILELKEQLLSRSGPFSSVPKDPKESQQ